MLYFVKCIENYGSAINNDIARSEVTHKYLLKASYRRTYKKEDELHIL